MHFEYEAMTGISTLCLDAERERLVRALRGHSAEGPLERGQEMARRPHRYRVREQNILADILNSGGNTDFYMFALSHWLGAFSFSTKAKHTYSNIFSNKGVYRHEKHRKDYGKNRSSV